MKGSSIVVTCLFAVAATLAAPAIASTPENTQVVEPPSTPDLTIKDTSGVVRNVTSAEGPSTIEFSLATQSGAPAEGAVVTLKNELTGEVIQAVTSNGTAVFEGVAPGTWVVSSAAADVTFTSIAVTASAAAAGATGVGLATGFGVLAAAGGTTALAVE
ncbi:MAG: hypothetical protein DCC75_04960, partial [Proteobacteria bacterium]